MPNQVELPERLALQTIAELHDRLCQAFVQPGPVAIDASRFAEGDLSAIQLIVAARAEAAGSGRALALTAPANAALASLLERCGVATNSPDESAFWFHGETRP